MPAKRRCQTAHDVQNTIQTTRVSLASLPIEIIAEILLYTCSPTTVVAVSRTCSFLYRSLALNPDASFIWRRVRKTCKPRPLPDPGDEWKKSEAAYAAFVFGGGVCEVCQKPTRAMYVSFSVRIRLCGNWHCRKKFLSESIVDVAGVDEPQAIRMPHVESVRCLYPSKVDAPVWSLGAVLVRKSDWAKVGHELDAMNEATNKEEVEQRMYTLIRGGTGAQRFAQILQVSKRLIQWKWDYNEQYKFVKKRNDVWTKALAFREGWNLCDLIASQTFGSFQKRKASLLEEIELRDLSPMRTVIESELLAMQAHRQRQKAEGMHEGRLTEVKKIYKRIRCDTLKADRAGESGSGEFVLAPPLSVFYTLPSVRALKGSPDPRAMLPDGGSLTSDIRSPLAISLIQADIRTWLIPVEKHLMTLLGYPNGWQSASTRTLPPLKRVTARFFCRRCGEGKVGGGYSKRERCMDLKGVCSHVCTAVSGQQGEAPQEDETVAKSSNRKGGGQKKGSSKAFDWKVDIFEKDERAISVIKTILDLTGLSEENTATVSTLSEKGGIIRCMTCQGWMVMDFETAIGHAHRHEHMEMQLLSSSAPGEEVLAVDESGATPNSRLGFERGQCELLLGRTYHGRNLCKKVNYGCKHCLTVQGGIAKGRRVKGPRLMSFHGVRSHVKEKHGIQDIGDEDFFCYRCEE